MKKALIALLFAAATFTIVSCGDHAKHVALATQLKKDKSLEGKQIELVGIFGLHHDLSVNADSTLSCTIVVGMGDDTETVGFHLNFGRSKNSVFIETKADGTYTKDKIELYDNNGNRIPASTIKLKAVPHFSTTPRGNKLVYTLDDVIIEKPE